MSFKFLAAFQQREDDEDHFNRLLRVLRATYCAISLGALWLVFQAAWFGELRGASLENPLTGPLLFALAMFITLASRKRDRELTASVRKSFRLFFVTVLALVTAETTAFFGWWEPEELLGWWRRALLVAGGAWVLLRAGEKAVQVSRTRREGA